jgi:dTDP-glucose 4,6-dehydratase
MERTLTHSLLVTGGAGFIGANFVRYWRRTHPDHRVLVLDALTYAGNRASLDGLDGEAGFLFEHGDIRDQTRVEGLLREYEVDTIVHFAAESHVDRSIEGPDAFVETNVVGTHALLKAARRVWLEGSGRPHRFHHVSTDEVYGSLRPGDPAFTEETRYAPNSPYSASKAASDHLVRAYHHTFGLEVTTSNCSNNYGPYQFPEKLIPLFLLNILHGRSLPVYGDGNNVRDWLHVDDHCRAIDLILARGGGGEVYNIGGECELENMTLITAICETVDDLVASEPDLAARFPRTPAAQGGRSASLITYVEDRPGHDRRYAIDLSKARAELGFSPAMDLDRGLRATARWYLENEPWWRPLYEG